MSDPLAKLLDSVSDAVSAMVIFSNEAGSNRSVLRNLKAGAEGVRTAIKLLVEQARETVALWNELGSPDCSNRMNDCCDGLLTVIDDIVNACGDIEKDPQDNAAKAHLLEAGKDVLKQMVALLQFNDLYEVMVALSKIVVAQELLSQVQTNEFVSDDFVMLIKAICDCILRRVESTHDIKAKQLLEESKVDVEKLGIGLANIVNRSAQEPHLKSKIPLIVAPLEENLKKAIKALKLTAKSPFDLKMLETEFQYHDEDFLDEIQVTTTDFHDSLNAIKKALKSGDEFEVERAIRAIETDLKDEIASVEDLLEETEDPQLRAQIMARIKQAKAEMGNILQKITVQAQQLLVNPDASELEPLLEGVEKIFANLFEPLAVKEIILAADSIEGLFSELLTAVGKCDAKEAMALTKDIQREIEKQSTYSNAMAETMGDAYRKQRILTDIEKLKVLGQEIGVLTTRALDGDPQALERINKVVAEAREIESDLLLAATLTTEAELLDGAMQLSHSLLALKPHMDFPLSHRDAVMTGLTVTLNKMKGQIMKATSWAESIVDNPTMTERVKGYAQQLKSAAVPMAISVKKCLALDEEGPQLEAAKKEFVSGYENFQQMNDLLVCSIVEAPEEELEGLSEKICYNIEKLQKAIVAKDIKLMAESIAELKKNSKGMTFVAKLLSPNLEDPDLQAVLLNSSSSLVPKLDGLLAITKSAIKHPKDKIIAKQFEDSLTDFQNNVNQIVNITDNASPEDQLYSNSNTIIKIEKKFAKEIELGASQAVNTLQILNKKVDKQIQLGQVVAKRCDFSPQLGNQVLQTTFKVKDLLNNLEKNANNLTLNPSDKNLTNLFQKLNVEFCDQSSQAADLAQNIKKEKKAEEERIKEEARLAEEKAKKEAEEKQRQVPEVVPEGIKEVWMDAQQLVSLIQETNLKEDTTPVGSLAGIAEKLARGMQELAALSKKGTKNQIITNARAIASMVDEISKYITEVTKNCRDPILNREMVDMGHVAKNYAVQLKIICGVKAGLLLEEDKDTAQSLIICAKGLCKTVGDAVNRAQIAKLKPIGGNNPPRVVLKK